MLLLLLLLLLQLLLLWTLAWLGEELLIALITCGAAVRRPGWRLPPRRALLEQRPSILPHPVGALLRGRQHRRWPLRLPSARAHMDGHAEWIECKAAQLTVGLSSCVVGQEDNGGLRSRGAMGGTGNGV